MVFSDQENQADAEKRRKLRHLGTERKKWEDPMTWLVKNPPALQETQI